MIIQNTSADGLADMSFTVGKADLREARGVADSLARDLGASGVEYDEEIAKLSVVGIGMRSHTGVAAKMFAALAEERINIQMISTSEIKISVIVDAPHADAALRAVHSAFELDKSPAQQ
jgi:aspartate kinase